MYLWIFSEEEEILTTKSCIIINIEGVPFGQNNLVCLFMKGTCNNEPPKRTYEIMKDPDLALKYISFMGDNRDLNLKDLTLKTVILVAFSLRETCPYSEFFWFECGKIRTRKTPKTVLFTQCFISTKRATNCFTL